MPERTPIHVDAKQQIAAIASMRAVHAAFEWFRQHESELFEAQMEMLRIPAPPFGESPRAEWLQQRFQQIGLAEVRIDDEGNVIGELHGHGARQQALLISAHIDTVFSADTRYEVSRGTNGYGTRIHAPGASDNAPGVIGLLAIASALTHAGIEHSQDIVFVGNVGEEGEGDLRGMRRIFSSQLRERIVNTLVLDGTGTESIVTQALGSRRFEVRAIGQGGHSWQDYGRPNPINMLARAISLFQDTPVPHSPRTTINIGSIAGGTSVNTIPQEASMRVDIRSVASEEMQKLEAALRKCVHLALNETLQRTNAKRGALSYQITQIGDRPVGELSSDARLLQVIRAADAHLGIRSETKRSSTDANIPLSLGLDAVSIGAGGSGGGAHTLDEWFDSAGRDLALKRILLAVLALAE